MIQFHITRACKFEGKEYKAGDKFDYDPDKDTHVVAYEQGLLKAVKVKPKRQTRKVANK